MNSVIKAELENARVAQKLREEQAGALQSELNEKRKALKEKKRLANMLRRLCSGLDLVHKGDLLYFGPSGLLILCEMKVGPKQWKFSNPWIADFTLTEDEIFRTCSF